MSEIRDSQVQGDGIAESAKSSRLKITLRGVSANQRIFEGLNSPDRGRKNAGALAIRPCKLLIANVLDNGVQIAQVFAEYHLLADAGTKVFLAVGIQSRG